MSNETHSPQSHSSTSRDIAYIAVFAALFIVLAFFSIPTGVFGIPIVLQNAVAILAGLVLGRRRGFAAVALVIVLGLVGLPVLAGGRSALVAFSGPTGGYLIGYLVSAWACGAAAERAPRSPRLEQTIILVIIGVLGVFVQYFFGALWMITVKGLAVTTTIAQQLPFLGPDLVKMAIVGIIAGGVAAAFPDLLPRPTQQ